MRILKITYNQFAKKCKWNNKWFNYCNYGRGVSEFGCSEYKCPFYHEKIMNEIAMLKAEGKW